MFWTITSKNIWNFAFLCLFSEVFFFKNLIVIESLIDEFFFLLKRFETETIIKKKNVLSATLETNSHLNKTL